MDLIATLSHETNLSFRRIDTAGYRFDPEQIARNSDFE
jgi:hypothetical protein